MIADAAANNTGDLKYAKTIAMIKNKENDSTNPGCELYTLDNVSQEATRICIFIPDIGNIIDIT